MFETVKSQRVDPIMEGAARFAKDPRADKINLTVGVYQDASGQTPIMAAVKQAEQVLVDTQTTKSYLALTGDPAYCDALANILWGSHLPVQHDLAAVQTAGGAVALRVFADLLADLAHAPTVWLQSPAYGNHIPLLEAAGLQWRQVPYYDPLTQTIPFDAMLDGLAEAKSGDIFLLQGPCHNPTGAEMSDEQINALLDVMQAKGIVPWLDLAYLGFGHGLDEDCGILRTVAQRFDEYAVCVSLSKSLGLYRDRAGALFVKSTQAKREDMMQAFSALVRTGPSHAPDHGIAVARTIFEDAALKQIWLTELETMRQRVISLRSSVADAAIAKFDDNSFEYLRHQSGMFSMLPLSRADVAKMISEYGIHVVEDGRINIARLKSEDIARVIGTCRTLRGQS